MSLHDFISMQRKQNDRNKEQNKKKAKNNNRRKFTSEQCSNTDKEERQRFIANYKNNDLNNFHCLFEFCALKKNNT